MESELTANASKLRKRESWRVCVIATEKNWPRISWRSGAATKKNLTAETQRTRRFRPWKRTLPASSVPGVSNTSTQDARAPRSPAEENPWQLAKDFRVSSTDEHRSVFIGGCKRRIFRAPFLSLTARATK